MLTIILKMIYSVDLVDMLIRVSTVTSYQSVYWADGVLGDLYVYVKDLSPLA